MAIPFTIGSSTSTAVLLEAIRAGKAPAAVLTRATDPFVALASIVSDQMYEKPIAVVALEPTDFDTLQNGAWARIETDGSVMIRDLDPAR